MLTRTQKRILIGSIYILIAAGIAGGIYWSKNYPTCFDGKQNGREEGVDCGTVACGKPCGPTIQPLMISDTQAVNGPNAIEMIFKVYNPNTNYGAKSVVYSYEIKNSEGLINGMNYYNDEDVYVLPGQTRYFTIATKGGGNLQNLSFDLKIEGVTWEEVSGVDTGLFVKREAFDIESESTTYQAVIENRSNYDLELVDIDVIVFDQNGKLLSTNGTNINTFLSKTERSIKVSWPLALPQDSVVLTEVGTNIFKDSNFIKQRGTLERFQQYNQ